MTQAPDHDHARAPLRAFLVPAFLLPLLPAPLMAAVEVFTTHDWSDAATTALGWLVFPVCYWWPIGVWLLRGRGGWFARLLVGVLLSLPLYVLCLFVIYAASGFRFAPGARGLWGTYLSASPWFFLYVTTLCLLVRGGGRLARAVSMTAVALFVAAVAAPFVAALAGDRLRLPAAADAPLLIVNASVVDVDSGRVVSGRSVHLANGRIASIVETVTDTDVAAARGRTIDAKGAFLVPGLLDVHAHLQVPLESLDASFSVRYAAAQIFGHYTDHRRQYLAHGVTGVRDLGGSAAAARWMRDAVAAGHMAGPRQFTVGRLVTSPKGHPVGTIWTSRLAAAGAIEAIDSTRLAQEVQRDIASLHPDAIKIVYGTIGRARTRLRPDLLRDAIALAARHQLVSIVHAERTEEVRAAVEAGATGIEHVASMEDLPDDLLALMAARRPFVDATFGEYRFALAQSGRSASDIESALERARAMIKRLFDAGVPLAVGTDAPLVRYGAGLHDELRELQRAGLAPADALRIATINNAAYLGQSQALGRIAPGYRADLVLLAANPLERLDTLRAPLWTMVDGMIAWKPDP